MRPLNFVLTVAVLMLAACGVRGTLAVLPEDSPPTREKTVLVATSRTEAPAPDFFGDARSYKTNFSKFVISIPPEREIGEVEYPGQNNVDPAKQFLVSSVTRFDGKEQFVLGINDAARRLPPEERQGFVFVHGFNTNSAEGIIRATALTEDTGRKGVEVVYSWPSAGSVLKYLDDRESALFARDSFKETLMAMSESRLRDYLVVAHSMGTFVAMDTMRELAQQNNTSTLRKVRAIILISADLDIDVFRKQAVPVMKQGIPIILLTTNDDLALRLSATLRRQADRVGDIKTKSELGDLDVIVFDFTDVQTGDPLKHFKIGSSPEVLNLLRKLNEAGGGAIAPSGSGVVVNIDEETFEAQTDVEVSQ